MTLIATEDASGSTQKTAHIHELKLDNGFTCLCGFSLKTQVTVDTPADASGSPEWIKKAAGLITECCRIALRHWPSKPGDFEEIEASIVTIIQSCRVFSQSGPKFERNESAGVGPLREQLLWELNNASKILLNDGYPQTHGRLQELIARLTASTPDAQAVNTEDRLTAEAPAASERNTGLVPQMTLHPATRDLVQRFAEALAEKLALSEQKYGYSDGWSCPDWMDECRKRLREHIEKGDPRDVAAYCAFLWHHGERTNGESRLDHLKRVAAHLEQTEHKILGEPEAHLANTRVRQMALEKIVSMRPTPQRCADSDCWPCSMWDIANTALEKCLSSPAPEAHLANTVPVPEMELPVALRELLDSKFWDRDDLYDTSEHQIAFWHNEQMEELARFLYAAFESAESAIRYGLKVEEALRRQLDHRALVETASPSAECLSSPAPEAHLANTVLVPEMALEEKHLHQWTPLRASILHPASCGVSGHFQFQENGGNCMMCQREHRLMRKTWEAGIRLARSYGDNIIHLRDEQKERHWKKCLSLSAPESSGAIGVSAEGESGVSTPIEGEKEKTHG